MLLARALSCLLLLSTAACLPVHTTSSNATLALVLCRGLDAAVMELQQRNLYEHVIGAAWLERDCVSIDPCAQSSSNENPYFGTPLPALAGVWLSGNSSALLLPLSAQRLSDAEAGVRAENHGSLEFARVPEGLRVQACAPDFDLWRREGVLACNPATLVTISADASARACPGTRGHSLLDCVKPLQFDAGVQTLVRRAPAQKMHFGPHTYTEACTAPSNALAAQACSDAAEYSMTVPVAAAIGSTSLIKYEFLEGYACRRGTEVQDYGDDKVLSRAAAPNRVLTCPAVANGSPVREDAYTCGIACHTGFVLRAGACVSVCDGLNTSCALGSKAVQSCTQGALTLYNCSLCPSVEGHGAGEFDAYSPFECQHVACAPGTRSAGLSCEACPLNTFSNTSAASDCKACDTLETGKYQRASGQTACHDCLWNASVPPDTCAPGTELARSFQRVQQMFAVYQEDLAHYTAVLCSQGYACLPCQPGHYELARACVPCPHGTYQTSIGTDACYACASGQNTSSLGSTQSSDCVCDPGFE
jgi:hypothetical protein